MSRPTADALNAHLADGGVVQMTTYQISRLYDKRHAGWFVEMADGSLGVKQGKGIECLSVRQRLMVGLRLGSYQQAN